MNPEPVKKRSKVMRYILILIALCYFWTARYQVWSDDGRLFQYNKWTGQTTYKSIG